MGRIKTTLIKRSAKDFLEKYPDLFKASFTKVCQLAVEVVSICMSIYKLTFYYTSYYNYGTIIVKIQIIS